MRFIFTLVLCLIAVPAWAAPVTFTYGLYTGGVKMIDVAGKIDIQDDQSYAMRVEGKTIGIFKTLLPWTGIFDTVGVAGFKPTKHDYTVKWRGDSETLTFNYEPAGVMKSVTETKDGTVTDKTPEKEITDGTRDLMSMLALVMRRYAETGKCAGEILTFDGKRSMTVQTADVGETVMNNPDLSVYQGPAHGCGVKIIQGAGKWPKKPRGWMKIQQMGEKDGKLPVIWLAKPKADGPVIPVRIDIHTKYGDVIAHLTSVQ